MEPRVALNGWVLFLWPEKGGDNPPGLAPLGRVKLLVPLRADFAGPSMFVGA